LITVGIGRRSLNAHEAVRRRALREEIDQSAGEIAAYIVLNRPEVGGAGLVEVVAAAKRLIEEASGVQQTAAESVQNGWRRWPQRMAASAVVRDTDRAHAGLSIRVNGYLFCIRAALAVLAA